jgi:hypothetical protein
MATSQEIYRDLSHNGKLDGRYTRVEIERAFDLPRNPPQDLPLLPQASPRVAIRPTSSGPEDSTPATSMPDFWIALFLGALLVLWCVDRIVHTARRKR